MKIRKQTENGLLSYFPLKYELKKGLKRELFQRRIVVCIFTGIFTNNKYAKLEIMI